MTSDDSSVFTEYTLVSDLVVDRASLELDLVSNGNCSRIRSMYFGSNGDNYSLMRMYLGLSGDNLAPVVDLGVIKHRDIQNT